jgi:hypothetical protein
MRVIFLKIHVNSLSLPCGRISEAEIKEHELRSQLSGPKFSRHL